MARRQRQKVKEPQNDSGSDFDEVDHFAQEKEQILLEKAGWADDGRSGSRQDDSDNGDDDEEVMAVDSDSEDISEQEIEEYRKQLKGPVDSDEEYFQGEDGDEDDKKDVGDDDADWGNAKGDYYGAEDLEEEEDEDAREMEKEALRLQKKHMEELGMEDYMVDETVEEWKREEQEAKEEEEEANPTSADDISKLDSGAQRELLEKKYPEFVPLTKEFETLRPVLKELKGRRSENDIADVKYVTLAAYLGTVATYFALFLDKVQSGEQFSMKDDPIMETILSSREAWREASLLPDVEGELIEEDIVEDVNVDSEEDEEEESEDDEVDQDEEDDEEDEEESLEESVSLKPQHIPHLKRRGLEEIDDIDEEEKKGRRRALGFYTSKIDQREKKKNSRFQGDEDIPYKERLFERQQRLIEEARKRGDKNNDSAPGVDLDDEDPDDFMPEAIGDDDEYYNSVASQKAFKKAARMQAHQLAVKAAKEGKLAESLEGLGDDGKRAINYQILKNKGLTKKRSKDNRNSRVKKRKKYAKAQKKLKSVRAVYKNPEGAYQGEATGIKKNLSRSVKLR